MEPSDVKVGDRYVLSFNTPRRGTPLYGLSESLSSFLTHSLNVEGKDPGAEPGLGRTVMVRNDGYTIDTSTKSRKSSEPGVLIRLAKEEIVRGRVKLGWQDVDGLGLDPGRTYWVSGIVEYLDEFGDYAFGGRVEEQEFIIPVSWLETLEEAARQRDESMAEMEARMAAWRATRPAGPPVPVRRAIKAPTRRSPKRKTP